MRKPATLPHPTDHSLDGERHVARTTYVFRNGGIFSLIWHFFLDQLPGRVSSCSTELWSRPAVWRRNRTSSRTAWWSRSCPSTCFRCGTRWKTWKTTRSSAVASTKRATKPSRSFGASRTPVSTLGKNFSQPFQKKVIKFSDVMSAFKK